MFEKNADITKMYDFSLLSYQRKADFIEMVFLRQRNIGLCMTNLADRSEFLNMLQTTCKEKREEIICRLDGKLNFNSFSSYFCSFFRED